MKTGVELIAEERQRQIEVEGWTAEHDDNHIYGDLARAAACYAMPHDDRRVDDTFVGIPILWPWAANWWKPSPENRIRELQKAGALIAAEIDRISASAGNGL